MCGIVGFCDSKITDGDMKKRICAEMRAKIKHRGPDGLGEYSDEFVTTIAEARGMKLSGTR